MTKTRGTPGQRKRAAKLIRLAREEFGELQPGEVKMLRGAALGEPVDLAIDSKDDRRLWFTPFRRDQMVGPWDSWGKHRRIRASVLRWVSSREEAKKLLDSYGFRIRSALIEGRLDLSSVEFPYLFLLACCAFPSGVYTQDASFGVFGLDGSTVSHLDADRMRSSGSIGLRSGFRSLGEVRLINAEIYGSLDFSGGIFEGIHEDSIVAEGVKVFGAVFFDHATCVAGRVAFAGAKFYGELEFQGRFCGVLDLSRMVVGGAFIFQPTERAKSVDVTHAKVSYLADAVSQWPEEIYLADFHYQSIHPDCLGKNLNERLVWLAKHDATCKESDRFNTQPYRQLSKVLRQLGYETFADRVMYAACDFQAKSRVKQLLNGTEIFGKFAGGFLVVFYGFYDRLIGYGYERWNPFLYMALVIVFGAVTFTGFDSSGIFGEGSSFPSMMQPTQAKAVQAMHDGEAWIENYPAFRPLAYSADAFLPLVDLHQETYWTPKHWLVKRVYLPFHILSGWVVTTLAAVSVTGLVRHHKE
ncbi:MAG: hypothetical protein ACSHX5_08430 [Phycisphaerales bacterium]